MCPYSMSPRFLCSQPFSPWSSFRCARFALILPIHYVFERLFRFVASALSVPTLLQRNSRRRCYFTRAQGGGEVSWTYPMVCLVLSVALCSLVVAALHVNMGDGESPTQNTLSHADVYACGLLVGGLCPTASRVWTNGQACLATKPSRCNNQGLVD